MIKRSRKTAFGKANVVRRSAPKAIPVLATDPLALNRSALRKNVRTTLLFGTALGASLLTAIIVDSQPANAACVPSNSVSTNQANGIWCATSQDLTVVVSGGAVLGGVGNAAFHDDSGIQVQTYAGGANPTPITVTITEGGGGIGTAPYVGAVTGNGIEAQIRDYTHATGNVTINISNAATDAIGVSGTPVGLRGIYGYSYVKPIVQNSGGNFTVGNASGIVNLTNAGAIYSGGDGITGNARTIDNAFGTTSGTGGTAIAGVTITNTGGPITSGGMGLYGHSRAYASGSGVTGYGGHATATTTISNADTIHSSGDGIHGNSRAYANGAGSNASGGLGVGGVAVGGVTITNSGGAAITSTNRGGIYGYVLVEAEGNQHGGRSYTAVGGTATGNVNISNTGAINNNNTGAPKASGDGIYGHVKAFAGGYGAYTAPSGTYSGGSGTGGTAVAGVVITNSVGGTISSTGGEGIDGYARAKAKGSGFSAFGGQATATTTISNSAPITTTTWNDGIYGGAKAFAGAYGATSSGGLGVGGTAVAGLVITNNANSPISNAGHGSIDGNSYANAKAQGWTSIGGVASATTSIANSSALTSGWRDAIQGSAKANASGDGATGGSATGGSAVAGLVINNNSTGATLFSLENMGIDGQSTALADAGSGANGIPLTAVGGYAKATTTISNQAEIAVEKDGIYGGASASANATATTSSSGGSAFGGSAIAGVVISNSGKVWDVQVADDGGGLHGVANASATATGFTAVGGYAKATTTIVNTPPINSFGDGINGTTTANASAYGVDVTGSSATGGSAIAVTVLSNGTADAISSTNGDGIDGKASAYANAGNGKSNSYTATGGFATAGTSIANSSPIVSFGVGIAGNSAASANAYGSMTFMPFALPVQAQSTSYTFGACGDDPIFTCKTGTTAGHAYTAGTNFSSGSATGGLALAGVVITNNTGGTISSSNHEGIDGLATAEANAYGFKAYGGTASATTTIVNAPAIKSYAVGIDGDAKAYANAHGGDSSAGGTYSASATGGTAVAGVVISNGAADPITSSDSGIVGYAGAHANAYGFNAVGGTAIATTTISNAGTIHSGYNGIDGIAKAYANGTADTSVAGSTGTGGHAEAHVLINNTTSSLTVATDGISALAIAQANGTGFYGFGGTTTAIATTDIYNTAAINAGWYGLQGIAKAYANGTGSYTAPGSGTGGNAIATVTITNQGGAITVTGGDPGIFGYALAVANGSGHFAQGGTASATTSITNSGAINSVEIGIIGVANADASADVGLGSGNTATGGTAVAGVVITNNTGGTITSVNNEGIDGYAGADAHAGADPVVLGTVYTAVGGTASATTLITNFAAITSKYDGIHGVAKANASGYGSYAGSASKHGSGTGGTAIAGVVITNNAAVTSSNSKGIYGYSGANANANGNYATGGTALASTTIINFAAITSKMDGIHGVAESRANADTGGSGVLAKGGTADSVVVITNNTGGTISSGNIEGIDGFSLASAFAGAPDAPTTAIGGTASASTTITNFAAITSWANGIHGVARSYAGGYGSTSGTGGTADAHVIITNNTGGTISSKIGEGIDGYSLAKANAAGNKAYGGTASATTTIVNFAAITSFDIGIYGRAKAYASAYSRGSLAKAGTADAVVVITNNTGGTLSSSNGEGIDGFSRAWAIAAGSDSLPKTAIGGTASATTRITNFGAIQSYNDGIYGGGAANASAYATGGGSATGGTAVASVFITNAGAITVKGNGEGIDGYTWAKAIGGGSQNGNSNNGTLTATGGTAIATTTIINAVTGTLNVYHGDGIDGSALANANAYGSPSTDSKSFAKGGVASATVTITNFATINSAGTGSDNNPPFPNGNGTGIAGFAYAQADAGQFHTSPFGNSLPGTNQIPFAVSETRAFKAYGGTAVAITTISNSGAIHAYKYSGFAGDGIDGFAVANAEAIASGSYNTRPVHGNASGGLAIATVTITNNTGANITAHYGNGIDGGSYANTNAFGFTATGGHSTATTTITNFASILSDDGIDGFANAYASGYGSPNSDPGLGKGGVAVAGVNINNQGFINATFGNAINGGRGIYGYSYSVANGGANPTHGFLPDPARQAFGGTASATTTIFNSGTIFSKSDGIYGKAYAYAQAYGLYGHNGKATGGTANAVVTINNFGNIYAQNGDGLKGYSKAEAGGYLFNGTSGGSSVVQYGGSVGGTATASTIINNNGRIVVYGSGNEGIDGRSLVVSYGSGTGGVATDSVSITNNGGANSIVMLGSNAPGIYTWSSAQANGGLQGGTASATTTVVNNGGIFTYGSSSPGINAASYASANGLHIGSLGGTATAITSVSNSWKIYTHGDNSAGIYAYSNAYATNVGGVASASTTVSNTGVIITQGSSSPGIYATSYAIAGNIATGKASAVTVVGNTGAVITNGSRSPGIYAASTAYAGRVSGTANAATSVFNSGAVATYNDHSQAITAYATAGGNNGSASPAFNATAAVVINNSGLVLTKGWESAGVTGWSTAYGYNIASASTSISNSGAIFTYGNKSTGIYGKSYALAVGLNSTASANTTIVNSNKIFTDGWKSDGIDAIAVAYGDAAAVASVTNTATGTIITSGNDTYGIFANAVSGSAAKGSPNGNATATTTIVNAGVVKTYGSEDATAIQGNASAVSFLGSAIASSSATNSGSVSTIGSYSAGIALNAFALSLNTATASVFVSNSGSINTTGSSSPGLALFAGAASAVGALPTATISVTNSGSIITTGTYSPAIVATTWCDPCSITITNNYGGVIKAKGAPYTAIYAATYGTPGPITINNNYGAIIQGNLQLNGSVDTLNNAGHWIMQGNSSFGPGKSDTVNNSGVVSMLNGATSVSTASGSISNIGNVTVSTYNHGGDNNNVQHQYGANQNTYNKQFAFLAEKFKQGGGNGNNTNTNGNNSNSQSTYNSQKVTNTITVTNNISYSGTPKIVTTYADGAAPGAGYYVNGSVLSSHVNNASGQFHTIFIDGLETWNNNGGLITMKNGYANQQIVLGPYTNFNGTGNSRLAVDAFLGGPGSRADILVIGGNVTGTTHVVVNDVNPGMGAYNPVGIPVVVVGGNTTVTNFDMPGGPIVKGLFDYDLYLNSNKNVWVLASAPGETANELPRVVTAVQDVWHQSAGVWLDRTADLRAYLGAPQPACDPRMYTKAPCLAPAPSSIGPGVWARAFGDWSHNGGTADVGPPDGLTGNTHHYDVSYHQDIYGVQAGFDFAAQRTGYENLVFGFMAGAVESKVNFASGTSVKLSGGNIGAYATLINRGLFADALLMANFLNVNYNHSVLLSDAAASAVSLGGHFDMGYRFNLKDNWFAEPLATIDAVWTTFNKFDLPNSGVGVDLNTNNTDLRGRLGGRVGKSFVNNGYRWEPSVTAGVWHSFAGDNAATLTSGMYTLDVIDANSHSTYGEVGVALNVIDLASRWSAFVKGDYRFANDYYGGSVKGGVRFQW